MLIEFKIQLDGNGGVRVVPPQANAPQDSHAKQLGAAYVAPAAAPNTKNNGGGMPTDGTGTGMPCSGSGAVFVIGPIVVFGSGPGLMGPGGGMPTDGTGTGLPSTQNADASAEPKPEENPGAPAQKKQSRRL